MRALFQSMTSRIVLLLVAGVAASALLTLGLASSERQRMIGQFRDYHAVERLAQFLLSLESVTADRREPVLAAARGADMRAEPAAAGETALASRSPLADMLAQRLPGDYRVASAPADPDECDFSRRPHRRRHAEARGPCEAMLITLPDGDGLRLTVLPPRAPPLAPRGDYLLYGILFVLSIVVLAAVVARMTMQPLKRLAQAANALGKDIERPPLPETGTTEIRQAAAAFNAMQSRIRAHIRQRSQILAAVTHDLQTPLTRMRLRLEKVEDTELREKLVGDLAAMQGMVREGLDLVRSMDSAEPVQRLDLDSLIDSVCADAVDAGQSASVEGRPGIAIMARPLALRRCLTNLIDNACKYGGFAKILVTREGGSAVVRILDGGPGIPEGEMPNVFEPFYRVEASRSRDTGGTGLGLTIARNIAEQHGGAITLRNLPEGGLEARLSLPVADK